MKYHSIRIWLCGALLSTLLIACGMDPRATLAKGRAEFDSGNLRAAAIHLSNVLQAEPENRVARVLQGRIALASGDVVAARNDFERVRSGGADGTEVDALLADAMIQAQNHKEALAVLDGVADADRDSRYWTLRGEALTGVNQLPEAADALVHAVGLKGGEDSRTLIAQAILAERRLDRQMAEGLLSRAVDSSGGREERAEALIARGDFYVRQRRLDTALVDLEAGADTFAKSALPTKERGVRTRMVQAYLALNNLVAATDAAKRLEELAPNTLASRYFDALVAYKSGRFDAAVTASQQAVNLAPDNPLPLTLLGAAHLAKGDLFQAEQYFMKVVAASPNDPAAIKLLAETRLRQQRPDAALDALRQLDNAGEADPQASALQGMANLQMGDLGRGISYLEQAVSGRPDDEGLQLELARAYFGAGRDKDAIALLERGHDAHQTPASHVLLLLSELRLGRLDVARAGTEEILAKFPDDASARVAAAAFYRLTNQRDVAMQHLEAAVRIDPKFVTARLGLASLLNEAGRTPDAERQLREVLANEPEQPAALAALAQIALERGAVDDAASLLGRAVATSPTVPMRLALARVKLKQHDLTGADAEIAAARAAAPGDQEVAVVAGLSALVGQRWREALDALSAAHKSLPGRIDVSLALAQAQAGAGKLDDSRATLLVAAQSAPGSLAVKSALGIAEIRLGNAGRALEIAKELQVGFAGQAAGYLLEAMTRMAQRRYDSAAASFELAFDRSRSLQVLSQWAVALKLSDRGQRVEPLVQAWVDEHPDDISARLWIASLKQTAGRAEEAIAEYERVRAIDENNVVALNNVAWLYYETKRPGALELARKAYGIAAAEPAVLDTLGWILVQVGSGQEGLVHLARAAALVPDAPEIQYHYAYALVQANRKQEAGAILRSILARAEESPSRKDAERLLQSL